MSGYNMKLKYMHSIVAKKFSRVYKSTKPHTTGELRSILITFTLIIMNHFKKVSNEILKPRNEE